MPQSMIHMKSVNINSYAKVNIGLKILNKRSDGYHNISTVFQEIDLYDSLIISKRKGDLKFSSNVAWLQNDQNNLCVIAYNHIKKLYDIGGANIILKKNISRGSGLGSGSSNAAAVMKGLREIYALKVADDELIKIGSKIGADVPFFINGSTQIGEGIGEKLTAMNSLLAVQYLIVTPDISIDTKWAYSQYKNKLDKCSQPTKFSYLVRDKSINLDTLKFFENDFESIIVPSYPKIGSIKDTLRDSSARFASLSGSGSTVYAIFDDEADAKSVESQFSRSHITFITQPYLMDT